MGFSEKLRTARRQKGFSQEQLAELLNISRQAVSKWEMDDGYPETEKLIQLAETLGVSLDYLLMNGKAIRNNDDTPQSNSSPVTDGKITIRSYDGSRLASYNDFTIMKIAFPGKKDPKCLLGARESGAGIWGGTATLGYYATMEDANKELDEINNAIRNGRTTYELKYITHVKGRLNPKIVENNAEN
jgi:transcriptional regulator with XRE-family HTH domain